MSESKNVTFNVKKPGSNDNEQSIDDGLNKFIEKLDSFEESKLNNSPKDDLAYIKTEVESIQNNRLLKDENGKSQKNKILNLPWSILIISAVFFVVLCVLSGFLFGNINSLYKEGFIVSLISVIAAMIVIFLSDICCFAIINTKERRTVHRIHVDDDDVCSEEIYK